MLVIFGLLACLGDAASPVPPPAASPGTAAASEPAAGWLASVDARIRDASHAFVADPGGLSAEVAEQGIQARLDAGGVTLTKADDVLQVRTLGIGRWDADATPAPVLGACVPGMDEPDGRCVQRAEFVTPGWTESWVARTDGFEQAWTILRAPSDAGELAIHVGLEGAEIEVVDSEVRLFGDLGGEWLVSGLSAWDALGRSLPARIVPAPAGFDIVVDATGAEWPIEVDPVYSTATWTMAGVAGNAPFASAVAGAGDVNGDGYDDVIVGAYKYATVTGQAYVFPGSASGVSTLALATLTGETTYAYFGSAVAGAGDVNADGFDDVMVGSLGYNGMAGRAYLYFGSTSGLASTPATTLDGVTAWDEFGSRVVAAGDVNGDGYADGAVVAGFYGSRTGRVYVYLGSAAGFSTASTTLTGTATYQYFGQSIDGDVDVNGDGYDDLIVGAPSYKPSTGSTSNGQATVYLGSATGLSSTEATAITGPAAGDILGYSVAGAGDVNADGYDDVLLGAPGTGDFQGVVYLHLGGASGLSATPALTLEGAAADDNFGAAVARGGDLDADGYGDVVIGAYGHAAGTGRVYAYHGSATGLAATPTTTLTGEAAANYFGIVLDAAGDTNGDGFSDVIVGAYGYDSSTGRAYVYDGSAAGLGAAPATKLDGDTASFFGTSVAGAGDVNGDGYDDVIVGAHAWHGAIGRAYVYVGSASGLPDTALATLTGEASGNFFGCSVSGAGDVDGDGFDDVLVGAYGYSSYTGRAYVFRGSSAGVSSTAAATLTGSAKYTRFGYSVADAGDVDADGFGDVVVGAYSYGSGMGRAYIYRGGSSGLSTTTSTTITGSTTKDYLGISVSGAGDVDGDGYDDVVVGAYGNTSYRGAAYVHRGSASGVSSTAATTLTGPGTNAYFGFSVADAGDVNGDGRDDVIVGAYGYGARLGRAYVYPGSSTGVSTTPLSTVTGASALTLFGRTVSGVGDLDADGYDDVVVGAQAASSSTGAAHVYFGSSSGLGGTPTTLTGAAVRNFFGASVAGAGDVDGDGRNEVLVGAYGYGTGQGVVTLYSGY